MERFNEPAPSLPRVQGRSAAFRLPVAQPVVRRILTLLPEGECRQQEIQDLFLADPGLCLRLLGETNRTLEGLGIPVTTVGQALQVLGQEVLRRLLDEALADPESELKEAALEDFRCRVLRGLIAESLAGLLDTVDPQEARVAGLLALRPGEKNARWKEALGSLLPSRLRTAVLGQAPRRRRRPGEDLPGLLDLAEQLAWDLGGVLQGTSMPALVPDLRLEQLMKTAHDHVVRELADALLVLGLGLGLPGLQVDNFTQEFRRLLQGSRQQAPLSPRLPHLLKAALHTLWVCTDERGVFLSLLHALRSMGGVERVLLVLNDAGQAVAGQSRGLFFVREGELFGLLPGFEDLLLDVQEEGRPRLLRPDLPGAALLKAFKAKSLLLLPFTAAGRTLGSVVVHLDGPLLACTSVDEQEPKMGAALFLALETLLRAAGEALERIQLTRTGFLLTERMTQDELTLVLKRAHLMDLLEAEVRAANRYRRPLALAMIDVDRFKEWNDQHGHQMGDRILKDVAQVIRECSRDTDLVGRYGGDEFIVVLRGASIKDAQDYAERVRSRAENLGRIMGDCYELALTLSIGVAAVSQYPVESGALLFRADHALYRSKRGGRNRICADHG